jgi:hypothetical protein
MSSSPVSNVQSLAISPIFRDCCQIIVRKGAISFVRSLSQCFSSSDPATFEEFKFNSTLTTPLHVMVISGLLTWSSTCWMQSVKEDAKLCLA